MGKSDRLRKESDYETSFKCAGGWGILREEVWVDEEENVVKYNLAFILPHVSGVDHGRVLGYDNAHGFHERHFFGMVEEIAYKEFSEIVMKFYQEVEAIRSDYED